MACSDAPGGQPGAPAGYGATSGASASPDDDGGRYGYGSGQGGDDAPAADGGPAAAGTVVASNFSFSPATVKAKAGETIELENADATTPHTFTVTDEDIDLELDPGSSNTATIDLPAGTYPFECRFHASQGMRGTLVVT